MRADALANRERILAAARDLFAERGTDVDVRVICERAGVGMGTLYRHFPTKEALVETVAAAMATELAELMDRFERRDNLRPPIVEWLALQDRYGLMGREIHARFARRPPPSSDQADPFLAIAARREKQWLEMQAAGGMRQDIPARFMMEASDGLVDLYLDLRTRWDALRAQEWLGSIFAYGVQPAGPITAADRDRMSDESRP